MTVPSSWFEERPERSIVSVQEVRQDEADFGPQIVVEVLPLGETVNRPLFFSAKNPTSPRSKWQKFLRAWKDIGVVASSADDLIGKIVMIEQVPQTFKINGDTVESTFPKPIKTYASEADAIPDLDELNQGSVDEATAVTETSTEPVSGITDEMVDTAATVYEALGGEDNQFLGVAESSYPGVDASALLDAVKARAAEG